MNDKHQATNSKTYLPMKTNITLLLLLFATASFAQTIRRVNNNPGVSGTNIYTTIQAAHDAAANGDIIYVEPSGNSYGNLEMNKQLTIYGNGYFLEQNIGIAVDTRLSTIGTTNIYSGASGSNLEGLTSQSSVNIYSANSISIRRNRIAGLTVTTQTASNSGVYSNLSSLSIIGNYIVSTGSPNGISMDSGSKTITNVLISSNFILIRQNASYFFSINSANITGVVLRNNLIAADFIKIANATLADNLIITNVESAFTSAQIATCCYNYYSNVSFMNNAGLILPAGDGNINNVDVKGEFAQAYPCGGGTCLTGATYDSDSRFQLKSGSSLKTAGTGGIEIGPFGGSTPYKLSGIPSTPSISKFNPTPTGSSTTPLSVIISTKSNN